MTRHPHILPQSLARQAKLTSKALTTDLDRKKPVEIPPAQLRTCRCGACGSGRGARPRGRADIDDSRPPPARGSRQSAVSAIVSRTCRHPCWPVRRRDVAANGATPDVPIQVARPHSLLVSEGPLFHGQLRPHARMAQFRESVCPARSIHRKPLRLKGARRTDVRCDRRRNKALRMRRRGCMGDFAVAGCPENSSGAAIIAATSIATRSSESI